VNIVLITQNEPFYLQKSLSYLIENLPESFHIRGVVLLSPSPFGKRLTNFQKFTSTIKIFGLRFTLYYLLKLVSATITNSGVEKFLRKKKIPIISLDDSINASTSINKISEYKPDLLVSIQGNEIFKEPIITLAPKGCLNLHTALLPKYRGLMPSFWVLKNREEKTGVSVFFVDEGIDSGPILVQREVFINDMTQEQLIIHTKQVGMDCIIEAINKIYIGDISTLLNEDNDMTYFGFPTRNDVIEFRRVGGKFF
jgi:methionyl-tRNA formyltransferase